MGVNGKVALRHLVQG